MIQDFKSNDFLDKNFRKGHTFNNFLRSFNDIWGFIKVVDNSVKYMYNNFRKNIMTGS